MISELMVVFVLLLGLPMVFSSTTTTVCSDFNCSVAETGSLIGYMVTTGLGMLFPSTASKYIFVIVMMSVVGGGTFAATKSWILGSLMSLFVIFFGIVTKMVSSYFGIGIMVATALIVALKLRKVFTS